MELAAQGVIAVALLLAFCIYLMFMIERERKKYEVDEFDGGFVHDNRPRVTTIIYSNFIEEDKNVNNS